MKAPISKDPRGPMRIIKSVQDAPECKLVTFDCGHVGQMASHFSFKVGSMCRCFACRCEALAETTS